MELLTVPTTLPTTAVRFSLEFRQVIDLVMAMVQRNPAKRITLDKIVEFVEGNRLFTKYKERETVMKENKVNHQFDFVVKDFT